MYHFKIALDLTSIADKPWHISSSSAKTGDGIDEGVQWLIQQILPKNRRRQSKKDKSKRT